MKRKLLIILMGVMAIILAGCTEADIINYNIDQSADSFEIQRRVIFFNGITDEYLLTIDGLCSLGNSDSSNRLRVTCKVGKDEYKRHYLGLSDNVSFFVEQTDAITTDPYHYRVIFRPESIIPDIDIQTSN